MFIRENKTKNRKTGVVYTKHVLVSSYATDKGPRQKVVMHLGELQIPRKQWKLLAAMLESRLHGQEELFPIRDKELEAIADDALTQHKLNRTRQQQLSERQESRELQSVDIHSINASKARSFGPELIANAYWDRLGFERILDKQNFNARQRALLKTIILGRLIQPGSELATWRRFRENSALPELLNNDISTLNKNPFYEVSDALWEKKEDIEEALWKHRLEALGHTPRIFLYDLTNTYFEGMCQSNPMAQFGHSKEKRYDCRLVSLAMVVDQDGLPVRSRIYNGNQGEPMTLKDILADIYPTEGELFRPTIIMDRGIATTENMAMLAEKGLPYAVVERQKHEQKYTELLSKAPEGFELWQDSHEQTVYLKRIEHKANEVRVLVKSIARQQKEQAIDQKRLQRFMEAIEKLRQSLGKGKSKDVQTISVRLGRLRERHRSIAKHHTFRLSEQKGIVKDIIVDCNKGISHKREDMHGSYVITTSHTELQAGEIWSLYTTLTRVEDGFRAMKSDLGLRPVYHQTADRTCAHLQISVLAYHLLAAIEFDLRKNDETRSWKTIREVMRSMQRVTISWTDEKGQLHEMRQSTTPEPQHAKVLQALEIKDPLGRRHRLIGK